MAKSKQVSRLSTLERILLLVPTLGGVVFGVLPFMLGGGFGTLLGFPGNDTFIYRLAGAATFGYGIALIIGLMRGEWEPLRLVVIATLTFNIASIFACVMALVSGDTHFFVYLIFGTSIVITAITIWLLNAHKGGKRAVSELSAGEKNMLWLGVVLSGAFGLLPLLIPSLLAQLVGFKGTDVFLIRQAGAASLGYAVMAYFGIQSGVWKELHLPVVMALTFNALSLVASVLAILARDPILIVVVIGAASLFVTGNSTMTLNRRATT